MYLEGITLQIKIISIGIVLLLAAGCTINPRSYSYGLNDNRVPTGLSEAPNGSFATPQTKRDRTPQSSYTQKASKGAPDERQYSQTQLDVQKASRLINSYRNQHGLKPVRLNVLLTKAAKAHSSDLAQWDRISHFGSNGSTPWDRVKQTGYRASLAAENVGTGQSTFEEVLDGWKKSPGHNKNLLLRDAEHLGIALVYASNTEFRTFWTLVMGAPL